MAGHRPVAATDSQIYKSGSVGSGLVAQHSPQSWRRDDKGSRMFKSYSTNAVLSSSSSSTSSDPPSPSLSTSSVSFALPPTQTTKPPFFPFRPLSNLRYPFSILVVLPGGLSFAATFVLQAISPLYYERVYGLNSLEIGLTYLSGGLGNVLSSLAGGRILDYMLAKSKARRGFHIPEDRLTPNAFFCLVFVVPAGCLLFGWGIQKDLHLAVSIVGSGLANFGMTQVILSVSSYLIDAIPTKSASAIASLSFIRNGFACILGLVSDPMERSLGAGWIGAMLAILNFVAIICFVIVKWKGEKWRRRSDCFQLH